ncbi:MAG: glycosyltransferase family 4 protein [Cyanobacteria bacterium P01_H01_bin.15]
MKVLHIIPALTLGGASRALLILVQSLAKTSDLQQSVLSLMPVGAQARELAARHGIEQICDRNSEIELHHAIAAAEIVQIHFWNHPQLYQFLQKPFPAARIVFWCHIGGVTLPQVLSPEIIDFADQVVATSTYTVEKLRDHQEATRADSIDVIPACTDFKRLLPFERQDHSGYNVGFIGTTTPNKIHPDFVRMSAEIGVPGIRFIVCGGESGCRTLQRQASQLGVSDKFQFLGYREDIQSVLATLDVFGYPLCPDNYSTVELVLQETMAMGVPPVVFNYGGAARTVIHNQTGLVVCNQADYKNAITYLYHNPRERKRLGNQAQQYIQKEFSPARLANAWLRVYERLCQRPKRSRQLFSAEQLEGSRLFVPTLGNLGNYFRANATSTNLQELINTDDMIACSFPALCDRRGGGLLHYQEAYPRDTFLAFWVGLTYQYQGDNIRALASFSQAKKLGFSHWRIEGYLLRSSLAIKAKPLIDQYLTTVAPYVYHDTELSQRFQLKEAWATRY